MRRGGAGAEQEGDFVADVVPADAAGAGAHEEQAASAGDVEVTAGRVEFGGAGAPVEARAGVAHAHGGERRLTRGEFELEGDSGARTGEHLGVTDGVEKGDRVALGGGRGLHAEGAVDDTVEQRFADGRVHERALEALAETGNDLRSVARDLVDPRGKEKATLHPAVEKRTRQKRTLQNQHDWRSLRGKESLLSTGVGGGRG